MTVYEAARVCRSKNAGPFTLTIDLMFDTPETYHKVLHSPRFTPETIGALYRVAPDAVRIKPFERVLTLKVTMPRLFSSGGPEDRDVYGSQQHFPLGNVTV